jgi:hypothetical protein
MLSISSIYTYVSNFPVVDTDIVTWRSLMLLLQVLYHKSWNIAESDVKHNKTKQYKTKQTKPEDIKTVVYFIKQ